MELKVRFMEYFCLNCKDRVKTFLNIFMGFKKCCKKCGRDRLMELEEMGKDDFEKLSRRFKEKTGEL